MFSLKGHFEFRRKIFIQLQPLLLEILSSQQTIEPGTMATNVTISKRNMLKVSWATMWQNTLELIYFLKCSNAEDQLLLLLSSKKSNLENKNPRNNKFWNKKNTVLIELLNFFITGTLAADSSVIAQGDQPPFLEKMKIIYLGLPGTGYYRPFFVWTLFPYFRKTQVCLDIEFARYRCGSWL